jgi:hypothetical protein
MLALFAAPAAALALEDIAISIITTGRLIIPRIVPMARAWYQLVPEIHLYTDTMPESAWSDLLSNHRCNIIFHMTNHTAHHLVGTRLDIGWNVGASRYLDEVADFWERNPGKKWYIVADDDTFLIPKNLIKALQPLNPDTPGVYGREYQAPWFGWGAFPDSAFTDPRFMHGGAGLIMSRAMMNFVGPRLRNCSDYLEIPNLGADIRLSACINHIRDKDGRYTEI